VWQPFAVLRRRYFEESGERADAKRNALGECILRTIFPLLTELKAKGSTVNFEDRTRGWTYTFTHDDVDIEELWKSRG
jgi:hypothetical protein